MQPSVFTKIINGEIPCHKIYENEHVIAFLDIHPAMPGHTLVIPKNQVEFIWDLPERDYTELMRAVQKIGAHLRATLPQKYIGVKVVGVDVPHAHVHLIPFNTPEEYNHAGSSDEPDHAALSALAEALVFND